MNAARRLVVIAALTFILLIFLFSRSSNIKQSWQQNKNAFVGGGEEQAEKPWDQAQTDHGSSDENAENVDNDPESATVEEAAPASSEEALKSVESTAEDAVESASDEPTLADRKSVV